MPYAITPRGVGERPAWRTTKEGWPLKDGETFTVDFDPRNYVLAEDGASLRLRTEQEISDLFTEEKRAAVIEHIKQTALGLVSAEVPALSTYEMVEFLGDLWPHLTNPGDSASLAYARDVVVKARALIASARGATLQQLIAFDPVNPPGGWPATPA